MYSENEIINLKIFSLHVVNVMYKLFMISVSWRILSYTSNCNGTTTPVLDTQASQFSSAFTKFMCVLQKMPTLWYHAFYCEFTYQLLCSTYTVICEYNYF